MYKDKEQQREAGRDRQRRRRDKIRAEALPASVPSVIRDRYARAEPEYVQTIDRLLAHTIDELKAEAVWVPVWRYAQG